MCVTILQVESPLIESCTWSKTTVSGNTFRDVILYPGGVEEWDWRKSDTHHEPGIRPSDIQFLLSFSPDMLILSQGFHRRLNVDFESFKLLLTVNINFLVTDTDNAVREYNSYVREQQRVTALIHSTC